MHSISLLSVLLLAVGAVADDSLQRRQTTITISAPPPQCDSPCGFFTQTTACATDVCICKVWAGAGHDTVLTCSACIRPVNSVLADQYTKQESICIAALASMSITVTPTSPATSGTPY